MNEMAFRIFQLASRGYCCTQIMVKLVLEQEERENKDLIKALNGLCGGIGSSGGTCGVLTGGICIFGLYGGKEDCDNNKEDFNNMIKEYMEWFKEEFESTDCLHIVGEQLLVDESGEISYPVKCGSIIEKSFNRVWQIMDEHGYELGERQ
ncbi:MAG: C-GCAxxG-C-C family protein [Anaeromicrobium sp.]|jgi:C_GCAxxG_C_C family probable redox protein|uniref:DVU_1555 family C-GCAxxG-C-C protein n=1 Tax=Anaeromicrobium sp. TaxID=1929132 RepID=UPI0025E4CD3A|nr:DV_1555 family C-GCAxxG-C-C protein [Anaeromicrobium sp.]MCT4594155.1 C-GCAxxG-C-C family protein [Anaeromicrobium sp.]